MARIVFVLFGVTLVTFTITQMVPTDPARLVAGDLASEEIVERIRVDLGLDRPLPEQYVRYLERLGTGDLGRSLRTGRPVLEELIEVLPATVELALFAFFIIAVSGIALGTMAALNVGKWPDIVVRLLGTIAISAPTFWTGLILLWLFFGIFEMLPGGGRIDPAYSDVPTITGLYTLDGLLVGRPEVTLDALRHLLLPAFTLALASTGSAARLVRASLLDVLQEDYVRRAEAAGLSRWTVTVRYALPNALIPFVTTMAIYLADLLGGAVITEVLFSWPGLGSYTLDAISGLDFPAIMGFTLLAAVFHFSANMIVDTLYAVLDPRTARGRR